MWKSIDLMTVSHETPGIINVIFSIHHINPATDIDICVYGARVSVVSAFCFVLFIIFYTNKNPHTPFLF